MEAEQMMDNAPEEQPLMMEEAVGGDD